MVQVGDPTYAADTSGFHMENVVINTTGASSGTAQGLAAYRTQELDLESLYFLGNQNQTGMTLDGTGNYTGGTFFDDEFGGFQTAVNAIGHQVANPATTDWMNASAFVRLHIDCPTSGGSPISGTYGINLQQGDGNTFTGGDVEGCNTALHLGANAQNNTIVGLRNENSNNQIVADAGSSYNNWMTGGTMFTGKLTDAGTRNSFLDTFHRSFNGLNGDWYGSQQDATVTNHFRLGIGLGNERGLQDRYQTDSGYRWTMGLSDATAGEQFYQVLDELNSVYRLSIGQYNNGQSSTNNQTVVNAAGTGAVILNGSNNAGTGGVVFGSGGASETTVATIDHAGDAQFNGTLLVSGTSQSTGTMTVRNNSDSEVDYYLWPGLTASQKGSFTYKDWNGNSQWFMVKDASNNWSLNSAIGGLDSFKAYQSTNSGDTYVNASNNSGVVRVNYETGSGAGFNIYGGGSSSLYASFTGTSSIKFPGLAAGSGHNCLQIDNAGYLTNTGVACGTGSGSGTVGSAISGQIAYYTGTGTSIGGINQVPVSAGGTGASSASGALASLGAQAAIAGLVTDGSNGIHVSGNGNFGGTIVAGGSVSAPIVNSVVYSSQYANLTAAEAALASGGTIYVTSQIAVASSHTTPTNIKYRVENGGSFNVSSGQSLVFQGPLEAGLYQIFYGSGGIYFYGGSQTEKVVPQWFGATGNAVFISANVTGGSATVSVGSYNPFTTGMTITLPGAGASGANLTTTVSSGAAGASSITVATVPTTSVAGVVAVSEDDSAALFAWGQSVRGSNNNGAFYTNVPGLSGPDKLYCPRGQYTSSSPINIYNGAQIEGEQVSEQVGCTFVQANIAQPLFNIVAANYDPLGNLTNGGNGNNQFKQFRIISGTVNDTVGGAVSPVWFQFPWTNVSDTEFDHVTWQNTAAPAVHLGTQVTGSAAGGGSGTINAGSTSMNITNVGWFRAGNFGGGQIVIAGAGAGGANLSTYITAISGSTVTFANATSTAVTSPGIWPLVDSNGIKFTHCEWDVTRGALEVLYNATGEAWFDSPEMWENIRGVYVNVLGAYGLRFTDLKCDGCGNPGDVTSPVGSREYSIYVNNGNTNGVTSTVNAPTEDVRISGSSRFTQLNLGSGLLFGGSISVTGAHEFSFAGNKMTDADSVGTGKFLYLVNNHVNTVVGDYFRSNALSAAGSPYANSRILEIVNSSSANAWNTVTNNTFENTNASAVQNFVSSDYALNNGNIANNGYIGAVTTAENSNINGNNVRNNNDATSTNNVRHWGSAPPVSGSWNQGDIIVNTNPATNGIAQWDCVTGGTPGTWAEVLLANAGNLLGPVNGGLGMNASASTGITQFASGVASVSSFLANGTTATTQPVTDATTSVATDAHVAAAISAGSAATAGSLINALTANNSGSGSVSGSGFNGSAPLTWSYNTFGASPLNNPTFTGISTLPAITFSGCSTAGVATTTAAGIIGCSSAPAIAVTNMTGTGAFSITGSATNVTGTTNASLATLSALSLPYSQLSGTNPSLPTVGGALTGALASSSTARFTEIGAGMSTTPGFILEVQPSGLATHPIVLENSALTEPLYWVMVDASGGGDPQVMNASGIVTIDTDGTTGAVRAYSFGGEGSAATFAAGAAAGTSPGTPACTTSHVCDSFSGVISFTTGTSTAIGVLLTVTTGITRTNQPNCHGDAYLVASPYTALSARLTYSTTTIVFSAGTAPTASTAYELVYSGCGGY